MRSTALPRHPRRRTHEPGLQANCKRPASLLRNASATPEYLRSHPPESNRRPTDYERTQEVARRFGRVPVSQKIQELRVVLTHRQASAGTGMVTGWRLTDARTETMTY